MVTRPPSALGLGAHFQSGFQLSAAWPRAELVRAYLIDVQEVRKDAADYLLPILEGSDVSSPEKLVNASGSQNALVNKYLKKLSSAVADAGTPMPLRLTFHIARHSWADLARRSGKDVYEISRSMVHSGLGITERYLANFEGEIIDAELPSNGYS